MSHVTSDDLPRVGSQRASRSCHFNNLDAARVPHGYPPWGYPPVPALKGTSSSKIALAAFHHHHRSTSTMAATVLGKRQRSAIGTEGRCICLLWYISFFFIPLTDSFLSSIAVALAQQASYASTPNSRGSGQPIYIVDTPTQISH